MNERSEDLYHHPHEGFAYDRYNSLNDIHKELKRLKRENPDMVTLIDIGESHENRTLLLIKVGDVFFLFNFIFINLRLKTRILFSERGFLKHI